MSFKLKAAIIIAFIIAVIMPFAAKISAAFAQPVITEAETVAASSSAKGMAVIEKETGRLLYQKNADAKLPMASTTKVATAITVIDNTKDLDKVVKVPKEAAGVEGSSIYLQAGEELKIIDLLYGLMLQSGNDCAVALAVVTGGSVEKFAEMMNETAKKCGAESTNFVNPHGLHDDNHYTTALDLAKIAAYALKNPVFAKIVSTKCYRAPWQGRDYDRVIVNKNKLLSKYEGADGVKTGFTKKAGRCLVASSTRDGMSVVAVVLNCGPMFEECASLMTAAHNTYEMTDIRICAVQPKAEVLYGKEKDVEVGSFETFKYPLKKGEKESLVYDVQNIRAMTAPVTEGTENGNIKIYLGKQLIFEGKLYTIKRVDSLSVADRLRDLASRWNG